MKKKTNNEDEKRVVVNQEEVIFVDSDFCHIANKDATQKIVIRFKTKRKTMLFVI